MCTVPQGLRSRPQQQRGIVHMMAMCTHHSCCSTVVDTQRKCRASTAPNEDTCCLISQGSCTPHKAISSSNTLPR